MSLTRTRIIDGSSHFWQIEEEGPKPADSTHRTTPVGVRVHISVILSIKERLSGEDMSTRPGFYRQELNKTVWEVPERYQNLTPVGSGAYGSVW